MVESTLGNLFVEKSNGQLKQITWSDIKAKNPSCVAIFFTAWDCGPCRAFDEKIVNFYKKVNESNLNLELITIATDFNEKEWNQTYEHHIWPAIPMVDGRIIPLKRKLEVFGIPSVVVLSNINGERVHNGRIEVDEKGPLPEVINKWIALANGEFQILEDEIQTTDLVEEIRIKKIRAVENNILLRKAKKAKGEITPLERVKVWALFESFMEKKYLSDQRMLKSNQKPINMPEFLWNHIKDFHKNPGEAEIYCARLLLTLKILYEEKHEYGTIFCRLVQLYHPEPVDLGLGMFDAKARYNFEKMLKILMLKQQTLKQQGQKNFADKMSYELESFAEVGGFIPLLDISDLVYGEFESDRECGYRVMERLLPDNETKVEFTLFIVCWNMALKKKQPKDLFKTMDKDSSGTVETKEFTNGIKELLGVWLSESEIKNVHDFMDADHSGDIEYKEFDQRLKYISNKYKDKNAWTCTKARLLTAIADEYDQKRLRDFEKLQKIFTESDQDGNGTLELFEFDELCQKIDPNLDSGKIKRIFEEAIKISKSPEPNVMTPAAFAVIAMKHNIGGYGSGVFNAQNLMTLQPNTVDQTEQGLLEETLIDEVQTELLNKTKKK